MPARNLIFLSYAMGYAEVLGATHVYIGVNSVDYSGYPDCRPEFIEKFQALADYATTATAVKGQKITIETPLQDLSKKDIVLLGTKLAVPDQDEGRRLPAGPRAYPLHGRTANGVQGHAHEPLPRDPHAVEQEAAG